jgi:hypothetical protein
MSPRTFRDLASLTTQLLRHRVHGCATLVGVEGHSESGKSALAKALSATPSWTRISTDGYLCQSSHANTYAARIDRTSLSAAVDAATASHALVLIEGICLRDIMGALNLTPAAYVYCKRLSENGMWRDDPSDWQPQSSDLNVLGGVDGQSQAYHLRVDPLGHADYAYEWRDSSRSPSLG